METILERWEEKGNQIWKNMRFKAPAQCKESQDRCGSPGRPCWGEKTNTRTHLQADDDDDDDDDEEEEEENDKPPQEFEPQASEIF